MMTLEEAIKHAEATAIENEKEAKRKREHGGRYYDSEARACAICAEENRQFADWLRELQERRKQPEIIRCSECIHYDPPHVENEDARYEYSEMPKEAFDVLGTGLVSVEYGINIGGRCCVDYYCKNYSDDKRVYVREDNYCGRAERRTDE